MMKLILLSAVLIGSMSLSSEGKAAAIKGIGLALNSKTVTDLLCQKVQKGTKMYEDCQRKKYSLTKSAMQGVPEALDFLRAIGGEGSPSARTDTLRRELCLRHCSSKDACPAQCPELCKGVSMEHQVIDIKLADTLSKLSRKVKKSVRSSDDLRKVLVCAKRQLESESVNKLLRNIVLYQRKEGKEFQKFVKAYRILLKTAPSALVALNQSNNVEERLKKAFAARTIDFAPKDVVDSYILAGIRKAWSKHDVLFNPKEVRKLLRKIEELRTQIR